MDVLEGIRIRISFKGIGIRIGIKGIGIMEFRSREWRYNLWRGLEYSSEAQEIA